MSGDAGGVDLMRIKDAPADDYALAQWMVGTAMHNGVQLLTILHAMGTHKPPVLSDDQVAELSRATTFSFGALCAFFRRSDDAAIHPRPGDGGGDGAGAGFE